MIVLGFILNPRVRVFLAVIIDFCDHTYSIVSPSSALYTKMFYDPSLLFPWFDLRKPFQGFSNSRLSDSWIGRNIIYERPSIAKGLPRRNITSLHVLPEQVGWPDYAKIWHVVNCETMYIKIDDDIVRPTYNVSDVNLFTDRCDRFGLRMIPSSVW
jgi:hypothetical protein